MNIGIQSNKNISEAIPGQPKDVDKLEQQKEKIEQQLQRIQSNKDGSDETSKTRHDNLQKQLENINKQLQIINQKKETSEKSLESSPSIVNRKRFDEFVKTGNPSESIGNYSLSKDEKGDLKINYDYSQLDKQISENTNPSDIINMSEQMDSQDKKNLKGEEGTINQLNENLKDKDDNNKKPDDSVVTMKTFVDSDCEENHNHGPQCGRVISQEVVSHTKNII